MRETICNVVSLKRKIHYINKKSLENFVEIRQWVRNGSSSPVCLISIVYNSMLKFTFCMFSNKICNIILFVSIFSRIIRPKRTLGKTSPWIIQKSIKYCFCLSAFSPGVWPQIREQMPVPYLYVLTLKFGFHSSL